MAPQPFPIDDVLPALNAVLTASCCAVLSAPPGAGKTTRLPLAIYNAPWLDGKKILMLEPRRLAARRAATYMAVQLNERVGQTIGYRIRGDAAVSNKTRIEIVTEGILTRMLHANPDLPGVGLVIFDEFHERSVHADLGLALGLDVQRHLRVDLRVLVMSATLDGLAVAKLLGNAPVIESEGRAFTVDTRYTRFASDKPLEGRIVDVLLRALATEEGDVLVFLPGMREIRRTEEKLLRVIPEDVKVHILHGDLPPAVQEAALMPAGAGKRKVILSTSIAETSLTIDGVRVVVDSGLARAARFEPRSGMSGLVTIPVSRAVADQRRGRAGRQGPGVCYRLWTESEHLRLPDYPVPEICVSDLAHLALDLSLWGDPTGEGLQLLDRPPAAHLSQAQEILRNLGAITADGKPTAHGRTMASLPIHPRLAHMVIKGKELNQGDAACELSALLEERDGLTSGAKNDIDLESRIDALQRGAGLTTGVRDRIASQKRRLIEILEVPDRPSKAPAYGLLLSLAYPDRIARKRPERHGSYQLANGAIANLPQGSLLAREEFIAVADIEAGSGEGRIYLASAVSRRQLEEAFAAEIVSKREIVWDAVEESVRARSTRRLGAVILEDLPLKPEGEEITQVLIEGIRGSGIQCLPWNKEAERFRERIQWARRAVGDVSTLPDCSDEALIGSLDDWLAPFLGGMWKLQQLQRLNLLDILQSRLSVQERRALDRLAPSHLQVPSGSRIAIEYSQHDHPTLSVKLQELFGLTETPRVGGGTIPVTIHLLSPAARPLAVTQDLKSFWQNTYPEIRKQLRARYPKHPWPEDPLTATPTRRTVRRR